MYTGIGTVINYHVKMSQYRTIQFLRDANIKVCYVQADLASDAANIAKKLSQISMVKNISIIDFDQFMYDNANIKDNGMIYTLLNNRSSMESYLRTKFFDYLKDLDLINKQAIVHGSTVKYLFGPGMYGKVGLTMTIPDFMEQSSLFIVDYYDGNFIKRIYHDFTMSLCERRMRNMINMGNNDDLIKAEHDLDCGRSPVNLML